VVVEIRDSGDGQAHGGRMQQTSTPDKGTVATMQLPLLPHPPSFTKRVGHLAGRHRALAAELSLLYLPAIDLQQGAV
jgi:hypothetical protein